MGRKEERGKKRRRRTWKTIVQPPAEIIIIRPCNVKYTITSGGKNSYSCTSAVMIRPDTDVHLQEETRLDKVAFSRARRRLVMTYVRSYEQT